MVTIPASAALLDMDGTLVDSTAVVERLWWEWAAPFGLDRDTVMRTVHGRQGWQSMALLLPDRDPALNRIENNEMLRRESSELDGVIPIPGAGAFLHALEGHPHAIVTSADVRLMTARMGAAGLRIPSVTVTAESVERSKPDPEGFLLGAARLGFSPAECVAFEDSGAGIHAAKDAGARVIGIGEASAAYAPDYVVPDLTHVAIAPAAEGFTITLV